MSDAVNRPKVGLGVIVLKDGKVLLGKRVGNHGLGTWGFPGGHLEYGESFEACALREVAEEVGVEITKPMFVTAVNSVFEEEHKHYVTIYMQADWVHGEPQILEPDKMVEWQWFDWDSLPQPTFLPILDLLATDYRPN